MTTTAELIEKGKTYVLREKPDQRHYSVGLSAYYTGKKPSLNIADAKFFTLKEAKGVQKFATTGWMYGVVAIPSKTLFVMLLSEK